MNSPIANKNKSRFKKKLINLHHKWSQNTRCEILGVEISKIIDPIYDKEKKITALDFGCGDMKVSSCIHQILPKIEWTGTDIHEKMDYEKFPFRYVKYGNNKLPFENDCFDLVLLSDVLHHVIEKEQNEVIKECLRVGRVIIIKDTFEKGIFSRMILILMDIFGNWAYGVRIPSRYFTKERFLKYCEMNSISCDIIVSKIELYNHLPLFIRLLSPPDLHFIAVLRKK